MAYIKINETILGLILLSARQISQLCNCNACNNGFASSNCIEEKKNQITKYLCLKLYKSLMAHKDDWNNVIDHKVFFGMTFYLVFLVILSK